MLAEISRMMKTRFTQWFFPRDHEKEHFRALDGLRGLAILLVVLSHTSNAGLFFHPLLDFHGTGKIGVFLFFMLSAYLLDRQIAQRFRAEKAGSHYWKNYFLRRLLRIYPLFLLALISWWMLNETGYFKVISSLQEIADHLLLMRGENVFWSVPVEFKYYFLSPILMWFFHRFLRWKLQKIIMVISLLVAVSVALDVLLGLSEISTLKYLSVFLCGTLLSIYELVQQDKLRNHRSSALLEALGVLSALMIVLSFPTVSEAFSLPFPPPDAPGFYLFYAILWALVLLAAKHGKGLLRFLLQLRIMRFLGVISFSLYLFHMPVISIIQRSAIPNPVKVYTIWIISLAIASFTYLTVERPLSRIRLKRRAANPVNR